MILFLNGSLGVGKTSVANYLLWSKPKTALLESDALCNLNPFDAYDTARIEALVDILRFMIERYQRMGYRRFIVDGVFEKVSEIQAINAKLGDIDGEIAHYLLLATESQREENIRKRRRENFLWEIERSRELQGLLEAEFQGRDVVKTLDVTGKSVAEVGEWILRDEEKISG